MNKQIFSKMVASTSFYIEVKDVVSQGEMTRVENNILVLVDKFFGKHSRVPTREELLLFFEDLPDGEKKFISEYKEYVNEVYSTDVSGIDSKVLKSFVEEEAKKKHIKDGIVKIATSFDKSDSNIIVQDLKDLLYGSISMEGTSKFTQASAENVADNAYIVRQRVTDKIPTKIQGIDAMLYGGIGVKEITCIVAPSGRGKTAFLINLMYGFLVQGYDVLYLTFEMSLRDILKRLYRRILYENKSYMTADKEPEIIKWVNKFFSLSNAKCKIAYSPANLCSVEDIKGELVRLEMAENFIPKIIIVDHLDLMISTKKSIRQKEGFSYWRLLVDDLREIPMQLSIPIVTATQSTRASSRKVLVTEIDVGESYGKVQSSDVVFSLNQTSEELENKRLRVAIIKNRDYYKGREIELFSDLDMMLMCDLYFAQQNNWI